MKQSTNSDPYPPTTAGTPTRSATSARPARIRSPSAYTWSWPRPQLLARRQPGLHGDRVAVVGPAEVNVPVGGGVEALEMLAPAADRGEREPVGDRLAHRREVRMHAGERLIAADVVPEPRDDLVEDQQRAGPVAEVPQALEEAGAREQPGGVVRDRLDDDRGDLAVVALERLRHVVEVVEAADQRGVDRRLQHPGRVRIPPSNALRNAEHVPQHVIVEAVVAALELDQLLPARHAAREPDRVISRLRAAVADDHLLHGGHMPHDLARELDLRLGHADAEQHRALHRAGDALVHRRMRVPKEDRPVGGVVVEEPAAVEILEVRALTAPEADARLAAPPAGVDAARYDLGRSLEQRFRRRHATSRESK